MFNYLKKRFVSTCRVVREKGWFANNQAGGRRGLQKKKNDLARNFFKQTLCKDFHFWVTGYY